MKQPKTEFNLLETTQLVQ